MERPNLPPPPGVSPALAEFSARLMADSADAVAALPAAPVEPDPAEEYERTFGVLVDPSRWAEVEDVFAEMLPFCACGRVASRCDGSRRGCGNGDSTNVERGEAA
jgi:hypothetical protein